MLDLQELLKPVPEERQLSSDSVEVFFHNGMQYDHTLMRWEHEWAGTEACGSHDVTVPLQIEVRLRARFGCVWRYNGIVQIQPGQ